MLLFMCLDDVLCTNLNKSSVCLSIIINLYVHKKSLKFALNPEKVTLK